MISLVFCAALALAPNDYYDPSGNGYYTVRGDYYKGGFISSADDYAVTGEPIERSYVMRREFVIDERPTEAQLRGAIDNFGEFRLNGRVLAKSEFWRAWNEPNNVAQPPAAAVLDALVIGTNRLEIAYTTDREYAGGAITELFLRYGEYGEHRFERIVTDASWSNVRVSPPPPCAPHTARLRYRDYANMSTCVGRSAPLRVTAGEAVRVSFDLVNSRPPSGEFTVDLRLRRREAGRAPVECWFERIDLDGRAVLPTDGGWRLTFDWTAPLYFNDGDFELVVESDSVTMNLSTPMTNAVTIARAPSIGRWSEVPRAKVAKLADRPQLFVNDLPVPLLWGGVVRSSRPDHRVRVGDEPLQVVTVYNYFANHVWHPKTNEWNFAIFDREAELTRRDNPDAWFVWDLSCYPPKDFIAAHPEAISTDEDGDYDRGGMAGWSYASETALAEITNQFAMAIRYLESSPYANRIIGYRINSGVTIEWLGVDSKSGKVRDFAPCAVEAYKRFAAENYPEVKDPHVPLLAERRDLDSPNDILWDRSKHLNAISYVDYSSWICQRAAILACGRAKDTLRELGREKLVGTYFGYTHYLQANGVSLHRGHYRFRDFLDSAEGKVDYLFSPYGYMLRYPGEFPCDMKPSKSIQERGIMTVLEDDSRTHNRVYSRFLAYSPTHTVAQTDAVLRRNDAVSICRGHVPYHFCLASGLERDSANCAEIGREALAAIKAAQTMSRHAEVALVASERSIIALPEHSRYVDLGEPRYRLNDITGMEIPGNGVANVFNGEVFGYIQNRFARAGAPVDLLLMEDLHHFSGDYKLYVFVNAFDYTERELAAIRRLRERGAKLLWLYAPGWMKSNSLADMKELTGLDFELLGEGPAEGSPKAIVAKRFRAESNSTDIFYPGWQVPVPKLREIEAAAGVHCWCDSDDLIEANDGFVMMHTQTAGRKTLHLPRKAKRVTEVYSHRQYGVDTDEITFDAPARSTFFFRYE